MTTTVGFLWENWDRDREREVDKLNEYGPTVRVDWRAARWARLRASYAFTSRRGNGYDERGASLLMGHALEIEIANIVDPHFTAVAKLRKSFLQRGTP